MAIGQEFADAVRRFANWASQEEDKGETAASNALLLIAHLVAEASRLPNSFLDQFPVPDNLRLSETEWQAVESRARRLPVQRYFEVFNALTNSEEEADRRQPA